MTSREPDPNSGAAREFVDTTHHQPVASTLGELRSDIDVLTDDFVDIVMERIAVTTDAVRFKRNETEIEAPNRQREVLERARTRAEGLSVVGGDVELTMILVQQLIEGSIDIQRRSLDLTRVIPSDGDYPLTSW